MKKSEKLFFVFIIIILIPSVIFAYKAFKSIGDKRDTYLLKERVQINGILDRISEIAEEELLKREKVENVRPYYEYSYYFTPEGIVSNDYVLQKSPLSEIPDDKLIMGYFQIDDSRRLTTPYFFENLKQDEDKEKQKYKKQFLDIVSKKAYPTLIEELRGINPAPVKTVSQALNVQSNYENIIEVYSFVNSDVNNNADDPARNADRRMDDVNKDIIKYYPVQYLFNKGGVFAYRKVMARERTYIQGYMINVVYLTDNILKRFIKRNTPDNFSIYSSPLESRRYYASAGISGKLNFIKFYVYKNDNDYIDSIVKAEQLQYYISAFALFMIILVGCIFIHKTIKSEAEINKKKEDFISAVTHELKTPLTSIRLYSEMLNDGMVKDEDKKTKYYDHMLKESERLTRLINNVLDFSKIENNKKVFNMVKVDLKEIIAELCEKYRNNLKVAGFDFSFDLSDVNEVTLDRDAITQVFINLLDNSVKYSASSEEKAIDVKLYDSNGNIVFEVADKGIGIPKGELKAIFEKFYRIENELTRRSKGSGIGLSIVKEYVKAHNGTIEALSKEGEGTKIKITLPKT